jgi:hypothetical protein
VTVHVSLESCPALVLNADFRPLSYFPLSLWSWQDAIKAICLGRVNIVSEYERTIKSPSFEMKLPSVIALREYIRPARHPAFTRFNVFLRDRFQCQYCGSKDDLAFDHYIPRSKGGRTTWRNLYKARNILFPVPQWLRRNIYSLRTYCSRDSARRGRSEGNLTDFGLGLAK